MSTAFGDHSSLEIEVVSAEDIRKRALAPQSSGLSSSLARGASATSSFLSTSSTPTSAQSGRRTSFSDESRLKPQASIPEEHARSTFDLPSEAASSRPISRRQEKQVAVNLAESFEDEDFVPPHLYSLPSYAGNTVDVVKPGSLFEGVGRKLRGMDAVRFRQNVMRQTGFLEVAARSSGGEIR